MPTRPLSSVDRRRDYADVRESAKYIASISVPVKRQPNVVVIVLSGPGGSGKTHYRTNKPELKEMPYLDIAEIYAEGVRYPEALGTLFERIDHLISIGHCTIVVEGYFLAGSQSRRAISSRYDSMLRFVDIHTPIHVCKKRLADDLNNGKISQAEYEKRIGILNSTTG